MSPVGISSDGLVAVYFISYHINDYVFYRFYSGRLTKSKIILVEAPLYTEGVLDVEQFEQGFKVGDLVYSFSEILRTNNKFGGV